MVQFSGPGIDRPDRVLLANWKRLSDAPWGFDVNPQRNSPSCRIRSTIRRSPLSGSLLRSRAAGRGESPSPWETSTKRDIPTGERDDPTEAIFASTVLGANAPDAATSMAADLVAVRDLISRIDMAVAEGGTISPDELAAWERSWTASRSGRKGIRRAMARTALDRAERLFASGRFAELDLPPRAPSPGLPGIQRFYYLLGTSCLRAGDPGGASTYLKRAEQLRRRISTHARLAALSVRKGETAKAGRVLPSRPRGQAGRRKGSGLSWTCSVRTAA